MSKIENYIKLEAITMLNNKIQSLNENGIMKYTDEQNLIFDVSVFKKLIKFENCICKLKIPQKNDRLSYASGFFCFIPSKEMTVLITNNHFIDDNFLRDSKELIIYIVEDEKQNEKIIDLTLDRIKFTSRELDATAIEILDEDFISGHFVVDEEFIKDQEFLTKSVFNLHFPLGENLKASFGDIIESKRKNNKLIYTAGTDHGSSGSPIVLANEFKVIALHKGVSKNTNLENKKNMGIYLDKIIELIPKSTHPENKNIIKCLYEIKEDDVNKDTKIYDNINNIEKNIDSISIFREDERKRRIIDGTYRFEKEGKYLISYTINNSAKFLDNMFENCKNLKKIYMPSFSDFNIETMNNMFNGCSSLKEITFPKSFNTKKVKNMSYMFSNCESLELLNLSPFNTEEVQNMSGMFDQCESLTEINLKSFNTEKVRKMDYMFKNCKKLNSINLASFKTKNVFDLTGMFENCISLEILDLSSFITFQVSLMDDMFRNCKSLKEINLSFFSCRNNTEVRDMFYGCFNLKSIKNCKDKKIIQEFNNLKKKN